MLLDEILERNRRFVAGRPASPLAPPETIRLAVLACYDPRLDALIRPALGLELGEGFLLRTAGARVTPTGDPMRSFALAVYLFGVTETIVLGHTSCRMAAFDTAAFIDAFRRRGVLRPAFGDGDLRAWAGATATPRRGVEESVAALAQAPFLPSDLLIAGLVLDDTTGALEVIVRPGDAAARRLPASDAVGSLPGAEPVGTGVPPDGARAAGTEAVLPAAIGAVAAAGPSGATGSPDTSALHEEASRETASADTPAPDPLVESLEEFLDVLGANASWARHVAALRAELDRERNPFRKLKMLRRFLERATGDARAVASAFERVEAAARLRGRKLSAEEVLPLLRSLFAEKRS